MSGILAEADTTLSAAGAATVTVAPPANRQWRITRVELQVVRGSSSVQPRAYLYRNAATPQNQIDATYQGDRNATQRSYVVRAGETTQVQWTGGTSGDRCSAIFYGDDASDSMELPPALDGPGFELQITALNPQQPGPAVRTPVTLSSTDLYVSPFNTIVSNNQNVTGIIDVREWPYVTLSLETVLGPTVTAWLIWYDDAAGSNTINQSIFRTTNGIPIVDCVPTEAAYVRLFVQTTLADVMRIRMRGRTTGIGSGYGVTNIVADSPGQTIIRRDFGVIGAGAVVNVDAMYVQQGWATFAFQADAAGIGAVFRFVNNAGAYVGDGPVLFTTATQTRWVETVAIHSHHIRVQLINSTGAAANCSVYVYMGPRPV